MQPSLHDSSPTATTNSVTEKLTKLRTEHARAATNRRKRQLLAGPSTNEQQQRQTIPHTHSWPDFFLSMDQQQMDLQPHLPLQQRASTPAAGPPPPPSWTRRRQNQRSATVPVNHFTFEHYRKHQEKWTSATRTSSLPSLVRLCCCQLATLDESSRWIDQIKRLPNHIKQRMLFEWSFDSDEIGRALVTNTTMDLFERTEYEELWLEASQVSLERLIRAFWKLNQVSKIDDEGVDNDLVDDWEDLLRKDDDKTNTLERDNTFTTNDPPTIVLHLDYEEEIGKWKHLSHVMAVLLQHMQRRQKQRQRQQHHLLKSTITNPSYALSSPFLGRTLVSLNISFMHLIPSSDVPLCWTTFAYLLVTTLPHLRWLYSAGCFDNPSQGSEILTILSRGLRKLKFWDLGYHSWLQLDSLISAIDWQRDLMELNTLCLSGSNHTSSYITTWFKSHQLERVKLIWMDV